MKVLQETTVWSTAVSNHVYFVNDSRDRMFGYVPVKTGVPVKFSAPMRFSTKGRKFSAVPDQWNFAEEIASTAKSWTVSGSKGNTYTVTEADGGWSCSCAGFQFRGQCRHIQEMVDGLGSV